MIITDRHSTCGHSSSNTVPTISACMSPPSSSIPLKPQRTMATTTTIAVQKGESVRDIDNHDDSQGGGHDRTGGDILQEEGRSSRELRVLGVMEKWRLLACMSALFPSARVQSVGLPEPWGSTSTSASASVDGGVSAPRTSGIRRCARFKNFILNQAFGFIVGRTCVAALAVNWRKTLR